MKDDFEKDLDALLETIEEDIEVDDEFIPRSVNTLHSMANPDDYCSVGIQDMTISTFAPFGEKIIETDFVPSTEEETYVYKSWVSSIPYQVPLRVVALVVNGPRPSVSSTTSTLIDE